MAGVQRFELQSAVLETVILPLDDTPIYWRREWDSNPRMVSHHWFSGPAPSSTRTPLHMAEGKRFELLEPFQVRRFSKPLH